MERENGEIRERGEKREGKREKIEKGGKLLHEDGEQRQLDNKHNVTDATCKTSRQSVKQQLT